jgi:hypothetical protein
MKELSVLCRNIPGQLAEVAQTLASNSFNIEAFCIVESGNFSIVRLVVNDPQANAELAAAKLREKFEVRTGDVLAYQVPNIPGLLAKTAALFKESSINIEYAYQTLSKEPQKAIFLLRVDKTDEARELLVHAHFGDLVESI